VTSATVTPGGRRRRPAWTLAAGAVVLAAMAAVALGGCTGEAGSAASSSGCEPSDIAAHDDQTIVIEGDAWSGYAAFRDPDLLDGTGYTAQYVEQVCQDVRAADLTAGRAGIAVTTLDQFVLHQPDATLVGVIDQSLGADALVLNTVDVPYLDSIDDLPELVEQYEEGGEQPVLAYTGNSPSEMLLNELANTSEELDLTDFDLVSVDQSASAYEMLRDNRAQLAVIWEPETSAAEAAGYTVALSSADVPDSIVDVIVASDELIERDPDAVRAVVGSFYSTMDGYLANPAELERFIAEDGGLDREDARSVIDGVQLYGTQEADAFMNESVFPLDQPQIEQSVGAISSLLALINPDVELGRAQVSGRFVHELTQ
jgi:OOP family OmpA-OmpF porin